VTFEVLRFETLPATDAVAVLELAGTFEGGIAPSRPRLLVEGAGEAREIAAVDASAGDPWTAAFAVPPAAVTDGHATFSLVVGRGPLIALPPPTPIEGMGETDHVELARSANELRHRAARAAQRAEAAETERDRLAVQLAAAERRAVRADEQREELRTEADAAEREAAQLRETGDELRDDAADLRSRIVLLEDDLRHARRDLRDARARVEALRREPVRNHPRAVRRPVEGGNGTPASEPPAEPAAVAAPEQDAPDAGPQDPQAVESAAPRPRRRAVPGVIGAPEADDEEVEDPARVGAQLIQPSEARLAALTPARIVAATTLVVLLAALLAILLGAGPLKL
jgi:hypothetical protein